MSTDNRSGSVTSGDDAAASASPAARRTSSKPDQRLTGAAAVKTGVPSFDAVQPGNLAFTAAATFRAAAYAEASLLLSPHAVTAGSRWLSQEAGSPWPPIASANVGLGATRLDVA